MIIKKKIKRQAFLRQRQRKALTLKVIFWAIGIFVLLIILTIVSRLDYFRINTIDIVGSQAVPTESVQLEANKILSGSYLYLWPRNNILWYSLSGIDNKILNTFQRFTFVESKRTGWKKISLNVAERKPYAVWCKERPVNMSEVNPVGCFLLDKEGFVFDKAPDFSGHLFVYFYGHLDSVNPIGLRYLDADTFYKLARFLDSLNYDGFDIIGLEIAQDGYYKIYDVNGTQIMVNNRQTFDITLRNLESALKKKEFDLGQASTTNKLDYIDLRFNDKILYKMKP